MDQGSTRKRSAVHNFAPTVTKFCVMWEGQALPHDTKIGNCRCEIVGRRVIFIWPLIHGSSWSRLIKAEPGLCLAEHSLSLLRARDRKWAHNGTNISYLMSNVQAKCSFVPNGTWWRKHVLHWNRSSMLPVTYLLIGVKPCLYLKQ